MALECKSANAAGLLGDGSVPGGSPCSQAGLAAGPKDIPPVPGRALGRLCCPALPRLLLGCHPGQSPAGCPRKKGRGAEGVDIGPHLPLASFLRPTGSQRDEEEDLSSLWVERPGSPCRVPPSPRRETEIAVGHSPTSPSSPSSSQPCCRCSFCRHKPAENEISVLSAGALAKGTAD